MVLLSSIVVTQIEIARGDDKGLWVQFLNYCADTTGLIVSQTLLENLWLLVLAQNPGAPACLRVTFFQLIFQTLPNLIELLESRFVTTMSKVTANLIEYLERHVPETSHYVVLILLTMEKCT
jgi:hypothetical protein